MDRRVLLERLERKPDVDVLIVGGGINGLGTFRELALNGVDVLLVEREDFCSGSSAASSHMAHGGIRYLENGEFRLVREAARERDRLLRNAPHLVRPLPTTIPIFKRFSGLLNAPLKFLRLLNRPAERGAVVVWLGLQLYERFSGKGRPSPPHRFSSRSTSLERWPGLNPSIISTATYYDGMLLCPERLALEILLDAEEQNPHVGGLNYCGLTGRAGDFLLLKDQTLGTSYQVRPKVLVNAAGPWIDLCNQLVGAETRFIGATKGSHIVLHHPELRDAIRDNEFFFDNQDGRILLILPLQDRVLLGTTDLPITHPDQARCSDDEIDYLLDSVGRVFPGMEMRRDQIVFRFSGARPLAQQAANTTGQITRDHSIRVIDPGCSGLGYPILSLVGRKWTTFRALSAKAADQVLHHLGASRMMHTESLPIGGGRDFGWGERRISRIEALAAATALPVERMSILYERYGSRAEAVGGFISRSVDRPIPSLPTFSTCEIEFLARHEKVVHVDDLLLRRTLLGILGRITSDVLLETCRVIGDTLGWSPQMRDSELDRACRILSERHGVVLKRGW